MRALVIGLVLAHGVATAAQAKGKPAKPPAKPAAQPAHPPLCSGDYADALPPEKASSILDTAKQPFVFAIRNTATYEHVYYGRDGKLRRAYLRSLVHGTGFGYRIVNGETQLVTNEHVASQPDVTDDEHPVEGVPTGSKKVREQLKIVRDETDDYEPGHIVLAKVLSDPQADIAVLKARKQLGVMPYRIGRSSALRSGNLVQVRGFPLGAFQALNTGKVVNPMTLDTERGWNHADFMVDALLAAGNSGSPVFAVSCRSAEPELVGVYHAGYTDAAALNAVVAIDQLREELDTLKVPKRDPGLHNDITAQDRDRLVKQLSVEPTRSLTFPFGGRFVVVALADPQAIRFSILDDDYPLSTRESMALVDRGQNGFGTLDSVVVPVDGQSTEAPVHVLEGDVREHFDKLYESLWRQVLGVADYRMRLAKGKLSADAFADAQAARARLRKRTPEQKEILNICAFEADRANFGAARAVAAPGGAPVTAAEMGGGR
ncbi:MAG: trypsin-like peptidase domain-containing protein [Deltaproteobacteria bacterium]|nr:MAG: trypsin-like peptidase domain-containing protein [Deltaproteobacteria bacterium]TMA76295.1 MAG: trypsin-like peptidase domain-containing protein [Deltaproteobacteria bacterium]TMB37680.1 MAG: trypsin-like peptidase domain-containing protein [Deltaproteobacteria bacterium]